MTGAGRGTAAKELEDLGCYVVDNLPPSCCPTSCDLARQSHGLEPPSRWCVDVRSRAFFEQLPTDVRRPGRTRGTLPTILFLEATDDVLVRRQEAARRPHPLQGDGRLLDGHQPRARVLADAARRRRPGHRHLRPQRPPARRRIAARVRRTSDDAAPGRRCVSFGFKYGIPVDADFVADMRFLPNPHWIPELRPQTGLDASRSATTCWRSRAPSEFLDAYVPSCSSVVPAGYLARGQAVRDHRDRLHRRQAPQRRRWPRRSPRRLREPASTPPCCTATWGGSDAATGGRQRSGRRCLAVVALGGGHGLPASLSALRRVTDELTAVVTVADDGGSSGRLRDEFGVLPPGRPADGAGRALRRRRVGPDLGRVLQHRFAGDGRDATAT